MKGGLVSNRVGCGVTVSEYDCARMRSLGNNLKNAEYSLYSSEHKDLFLRTPWTAEILSVDAVDVLFLFLGFVALRTDRAKDRAGLEILQHHGIFAKRSRQDT